MEFSCPKQKWPILQRRDEKSMSSSRIPEELYFEILIRLPVKSLSTCKSVCKSWFSTISNPGFVKYHAQQNKNNPSCSSLLLGVGDDMHYIGYDSLESSVSTKEMENYAVRMRYPFRLEIQCVRLFGSCNGLVFLWLYDTGRCYGGGGGGKDFLCVWNPVTRESKKIPQSPNTYFHNRIGINGLAYDGKNSDYKFVIGICNGFSSLVEIFSLRSNSWITMKIPYSFPCDKWKLGVLVNGDLHWLSKGEFGVCIVYLDISNDTLSFKEIQLPKIPSLKFITVAVLEEASLSVLADNGYPSFDRVDVWEMRVYGVPESWMKRYVIANQTITTSVMVKEPGWKIMWAFKNGKIIFLDSRSVVIYDPKHGTAIERHLNRLAYFTSEVNYVESFVSLHSGIYAETE